MNREYLTTVVSPLRAFVPSAMITGSVPVSSSFISQVPERRWHRPETRTVYDEHAEWEITQTVSFKSCPLHNFPGGPVVKNLPVNSGDTGSIPGPGRSHIAPSPLTFNLSQDQGLFKWVSSSHQVAKELEFQLQHQSFQWIFGTDFL